MRKKRKKNNGQIQIGTQNERKEQGKEKTDLLYLSA